MDKDNPPNSWADFAPHSREAWMTQVRQVLKREDISELQWEVEPGWWVDPFRTPDQPVLPIQVPDQPPFSPGLNLIWEMDLPALGTLVQMAVLRGCHSIWFEKVTATPGQNYRWLASAELLVTHVWGFRCQGLMHLLQTMRSWAAWIRLQGLDPTQVQTTWSLNTPAVTAELVQVAQAMSDTLGSYTGWTWCIRPPQGEWPGDWLCDSLKAQEQAAQAWKEAGWPPAALASAFKYSLCTDQALIRTAALLRAWRWVTYLMAEYQDAPLVQTSFDLQIRVDPRLSFEQQLIRFAAVSLAGALGGANRLSLEAASGSQNETYVIRIQHALQILHLESKVSQTSDSWTGSYLMDHLTEHLARRAWEKYLAAK